MTISSHSPPCSRSFRDLRPPQSRALDSTSIFETPLPNLYVDPSSRLQLSITLHRHTILPYPPSQPPLHLEERPQRACRTYWEGQPQKETSIGGLWVRKRLRCRGDSKILRCYLCYIYAYMLPYLRKVFSLYSFSNDTVLHVTPTNLYGMILVSRGLHPAPS